MDNIAMDYILILISLVISLFAQFYVSHNYKKYSKKYCENGFSGADAARKILDNNELQNIEVKPISGQLTDNYNPKNKTVNLSEKVFTEKSVASVGIAAHECGHAIQDKTGYTFLRIRKSIVPLVNFASYAGYIAIMAGLFLSMLNLIEFGIIMEIIILIFQIITLPVEFNASNRALKQIKELNLLSDSDYKGAKKVLVAAALTYVASVATVLIQILRLLLILSSRRRND